jgi:hypothetical protein
MYELDERFIKQLEQNALEITYKKRENDEYIQTSGLEQSSLAHE